jgi:hypothetical protein
MSVSHISNVAKHWHEFGTIASKSAWVTSLSLERPLLWLKSIIKKAQKGKKRPPVKGELLILYSIATENILFL